MDGLSILDPLAWDPASLTLHPAYAVGNAAGWLSKTGAAVGVNHYLTGRLYVSRTGWLLLSVPNALVRGVFDAMTAPGVELPTLSAFKGEAADKDLLNAHISVMTADEVASIGADKINERGHHFHYALGQVREFSPKTTGLSRVWAIQVASPELAALRKSYGLSPLPNEDHQFHITVAVRRKNVLRDNEVSKCAKTSAQTSNGQTFWNNAAALDHLIAAAAKKQASVSQLSQGAADERKHAANDQIAKETAEDHLSEDPAYYEKIKAVEKKAAQATLQKLREAKDHSDNKRYDHKNQTLRELMAANPGDWTIDDDKPRYKGITHTPTNFRFHVDPVVIPHAVKKATGSVYANQAQQMLNPFRTTGPIPYDHNKPVYENIRDQLSEAKHRGDFALQAQRNHRIWRASLDPRYRYNLALEAFRGETPQDNVIDQVVERYGDGIFNSFQLGKK
jgi:hypothetical protein